MEVNKLSSYKDIKEVTNISDNSFKAFGIQWFLTVELDIDFEAQNMDQFITIFLEYNCCLTTKIQ